MHLGPWHLFANSYWKLTTHALPFAGAASYTSSLDKDFLLLNFEPVVINHMPVVIQNRTAFSKSLMDLYCRDLSLGSVGPDDLAKRTYELQVTLPGCYSAQIPAAEHWSVININDCRGSSSNTCVIHCSTYHRC